jgi:hypothetical protein
MRNYDGKRERLYIVAENIAESAITHLEANGRMPRKLSAARAADVALVFDVALTILHHQLTPNEIPMSECPHCGVDIKVAAHVENESLDARRAAVALRAIKSERRAEASRENGKKGGRPPSPNPVRPRKKR